jgi:hypothetical protein
MKINREESMEHKDASKFKAIVKSCSFEESLAGGRMDILLESNATKENYDGFKYFLKALTDNKLLDITVKVAEK